MWSPADVTLSPPPAAHLPHLLPSGQHPARLQSSTSTRTRREPAFTACSRLEALRDAHLWSCGSGESSCNNLASIKNKSVQHRPLLVYALRHTSHRKEGKQLLEEDDDELVRQCHQALAGAAIRSGGVQQDLQQQSMQQPAGNVASQQQSVQQPAGNVNTQQAVAAAPDVQPQQLAVPSAADGVPAAVHPEAAVPGSPGPQEPAPAAAAVPPGGPSMFDELFGAGGAFS